MPHQAQALRDLEETESREERLEVLGRLRSSLKEAASCLQQLEQPAANAEQRQVLLEAAARHHAAADKEAAFLERLA